MKLAWTPLTIMILAAALIGGGYWAYQEYYSEKQQVCTAEAKLCPDGSYVGRTGPNCEFAKCPTEDVLDKERLCGSQPPILCEPAGDMKLDCIEGKWQCVRVEIQSQPLR